MLMYGLDPIYVSEMVDKTMNPTFRHIDFEACGPGIMRSEDIVVKVWVRSLKMAGWKQLLSLDAHLRDLQYLGKSVCTCSSKN
jgi:UV radiation resistance-associated gene protein